MEDHFYDLRILPPNPTQEQKNKPVVIENMTKDVTIAHLKRVIAKKQRQSQAWREIKLYFIGEEMIDSQMLGELDLQDQDEITAVTALDVSQPAVVETSQPSEPNITTGGGSAGQPGARVLLNIFFKFGSRNIVMNNVDLGTTFGRLRERVRRENSALAGADIYFVFGTKNLQDGVQLEEYGLHENATIFISERLRGGGDGD